MSILEVEINNKSSMSKVGLSEKEARRRLQKYGYNSISHEKPASAIKIFLSQFSDFMTLVLLASTAVSTFMGEMTEALTIIAIIVVNSILGFIQEYRTERTMEALKGLTAPTAKVIRDSRTVDIPAEEVVPGDLLIIETGDRVPADGMLTEVISLQVDESLLTGESVPVEKSLGMYSARKSTLHSRPNEIYMGTIVTSGRAKAVVTSTGMFTEMGKIANMIQNIDEEQTPLQKKLDHLGKFIVFGCIIICAVVSLTGVLRGEELFSMLLSGISLAVAAIPEGLPAIVTIALALGVQRMLKRYALVRKLPAVETLGCASIICSDKTGTLTENKMTVRKIYAGDNIFDVGSGRNKLSGDFTLYKREIDPLKQSTLKLALEIGGLCNNAAIEEDSYKVNGDPTEGALLVAAAKAGLTEKTLYSMYTRVDELPFDSERKCMSIVCRDKSGETFVFTKGAPDIIIDKCTKIYTSRGIENITPALSNSVMKINDKMAGEALRVLGVAFRKLDRRGTPIKEVEKELTFVGLIGMIDPPRREAFEAVRKCRMAGIKTVMITGDHKVTATAIAKELSIFNDGEKVLTGADLEEMGENKFEKIAGSVSVYARVSPKHKLMIVKALKKLGHIVAMTGDGVNDAPAVKEADIGISMGITGTDVTKEASSMILMDDNFATIVAAIEEGRVIYSNIRKFIRYLLSCNIGEVLTMFLGTLVGLPIPLLPIQILWVNLVTDGLPAIALGLEPSEKDIMMRPPRGSKETIFSGGLLGLILLRGVLLGLSTLAVFVSILYFTSDITLARTGGFVTLVLTQLTHVFECKSERRTIFEIPIFSNLYLVLAVICSLAMILAVVYIPFFQPIFKTVPLTLNEWTMVGGFTALGPVVTSLFWKRRR